MVEKNQRVKLLFVLLGVFLFLNGCEKMSSGTISPERLTLEELTLDWIDANISVEELERAGAYREKEIDQDGMYLTYTMEHFKYVFSTGEELWGERMAYRLILVVLFSDDNGNLPGPRGIQIGDEFEQVLDKFPQEKTWEDSSWVEFYGRYTPENASEMELGSINFTKDGAVDFMTLVPKGHPPFIKIHFKNNQVDQMIIYYWVD